jgi:hypothetical protein
MKSVVIATILVIMFLAVAPLVSANECGANNRESKNIQDQYLRCWLEKESGEEFMAGKQITVVCSTLDISTRDEIPKKGASVSVIGYDEDLNPIYTENNNQLNKDGEYAFTPPAAGQYEISVYSCDYKVYIDVVPDPDAPDESPTAALILGLDDDEPEAPEAEENETEDYSSEETASDTQEVEQKKLGIGFLDAVINDTEEEESQAEVTNIMLMLVGFLVA